jgi:type I restriction enzyme S subunit
MENGKAAIAHGLTNGLGFGSTEFHVLRPVGSVIPEWVYAFIRQPGFRSIAKDNFTGTAGQKRVPVDFLKSFPIPVPPLALQEGFASRVFEIRRLETGQDASRLRLDDLFQSMLHRAFEGEI